MVKNNAKKSVSAIAVLLVGVLALCMFLTACGKAAQPTPEPTSYTVVFDVNGGTPVAQQTVTSGQKITRPPDPTKTGLTFGGWYADEAYKTAWNFDTDVVKGETVLYAKWIKPDGSTEESDGKVAVVFVTDGGTAVPSQSVPKGGKITEPPAPSMAGKAFDGWYTDRTYRTAWNFDTDVVTKATVLYAKWRDVGGGEVGGNDVVTVTFNVGLDARKGGLSNPPAQRVKSGGTIVAPTIARDGYELAGWYVEDGDTAWRFASDKVYGNTTLYARWKQGSGGSSDRVDYTPSVSADNTLYIHYLRPAGDYENYYMYVWGNGQNAEYGDIVVTDESGAVFAVDLTDAPCAGLTEINFIVTRPGWEKDGGDNSVKLADAMRVGGSYHWFIKQGNTSDGKNYLSDGSLSGGGVTEPLRENISDVVRSEAASLPVAATATEYDETGVGYQIFVASFCDSDGDGVGDIRGIIQKLDYLDDLNVDVLWLTPVQSSNSYHGYDCYDYYCIDGKFGTNADYRELVYKAHQKGIKVIMDLVVNHTSPNNEWFIKSKAGVVETVTYQDGTTAEVHYRDFYRWSRTGGTRKYSSGDGWYFYSSFGSNMPELNYDCQAVRNAMADVAAYWMNFGLDGFRMDAIKHVFMSDESENASTDRIAGDSGWQYNLDKNVEFFKEFNGKLKSKYPHCFLLGEQLDGNADNVAPFYAGMDSLFDFSMHYSLPDRIKSGNASAVANSANANAQKYASFRKDRAINSNISSNHDIPRLSSYFTNQDQIKLYFAVTLTMQGLSWIYYGDEIGLMGKAGNDKNYRQSMKWTRDWENGCSNVISGKELNAATVSVAEQSDDQNSLLNYVKSLTALRNEYPCLINGDATCSTSDGMLKITVTDGTQSLTVYHNFTTESKRVSGNAVFGNASNIAPYGTAVIKN